MMRQFALLAATGLLLADAMRQSFSGTLETDSVPAGSFTGADEGKMFCSPKLPHVQMKMCVRLFTEGEAKKAGVEQHDHDDNHDAHGHDAHGHDDHGHGGHPAQVIINGIPFIVGPKKIIEKHGGVLLANHDLLNLIPNLVMEQGWFGCETCADDMKVCEEGQECLADPQTGKSFPWKSLNGQRLRSLFTSQCVDISHMIAHKGMHDILHFVPGAHHALNTKVKHELAHALAGNIVHKVIHGEYCAYLSEHKSGEELTGANDQVIRFPNDSVCIEQLWFMETAKLFNHIGWTNEMPPSPLVCWPAEGDFRPEVPWISEAFKP
eukprot:TRINITY_DN111880_c0_g1_i1.p1 TRINITY_DN111880_c0_g1~~TRINITY_DN111880_c0_g1_i1.p1  ORF type:complete len:322 (+),score=57.61 TRINITY_DN111880_c0_g1_i1:75-1040(+)